MKLDVKCSFCEVTTSCSHYFKKGQVVKGLVLSIHYEIEYCWKDALKVAYIDPHNYASKLFFLLLHDLTRSKIWCYILVHKVKGKTHNFKAHLWE